VTDQQLLEGLRQGDETAFDTLFRTHYPSMVALAESILRDRAVGEEITQDVLLELWRRRETLTIEESFRAYLLRSTRNRALNHIRHENVVKRAEPLLTIHQESAVSATAEMTEREIEAALGEAVQSLPARCREVFELSRRHGLRYSEIATTLDISVKTVEAQMGKALRILREKLAPWLPEPD
jgi:RNA polymerase sigma-70 factor (ECF subfamily)